MSKENVELVRELLEQFKGVDVTAIDWNDEATREMVERFYSPEVELRWSTKAPGARVYRGRDGVIESFREWLESFSEYYLEPLDFIELGDRVAVPYRQWGIGSTSGIPVEVEVTHVVEIRDDQIVRVDEYSTLEQGPRSRRALGVGDVAGERGDHARSTNPDLASQ